MGKNGDTTHYTFMIDDENYSMGQFYAPSCTSNPILNTIAKPSLTQSPSSRQPEFIHMHGGTSGADGIRIGSRQLKATSAREY